MAERKKDDGFAETLKTIFYALLIAWVIRVAAYEPFNIPSGSMYPTLMVGDYLFVSKFSYGYSRHSISFSPPLFEGRILGEQPERGDVVVFKLPSDTSVDYIKRIIGLPGDRIQVKGGVLHINGEPVERERIEDYILEGPSNSMRRFNQYVETLPNGRKHLILEASDFGAMDNTDEYVVPEGHFFAMGDNRDNSQDSRYLGAVGYVPFENLVGRAEFLFFSKSPHAAFWEVWKLPSGIRWSRFFDGIE